MSKQLRSKRGFTIIEVALVLAIGGLIMMMVFLALPALQRSQRDRQRQEDMSRLTAAVIEYQSNNRNRVPTTVADWAQFKTDYLGGDDGFSGPNNTYAFITGSCASGASGTCTTTDNTTAAPGDDQIFIYTNASCKGGEAISDDKPEEAVETANSKSSAVLERKLAFVIRLEGSNVLYCLNN